MKKGLKKKDTDRKKPAAAGKAVPEQVQTVSGNRTEAAGPEEKAAGLKGEAAGLKGEAAGPEEKEAGPELKVAAQQIRRESESGGDLVLQAPEFHHPGQEGRFHDYRGGIHRMARRYEGSGGRRSWVQL